MDRRRALLSLALVAALPRALAARPKRIIVMTGGVLPEAAERGRRITAEMLAAEGFVPGRDVEVEVVNLDIRDPAFAKAAADVVAGNPDVILVSGTNMARDFQARTNRIPILFRAVGDPVAAGLVASLARPGRNITGESNQAVQLDGKRLEVLIELRPRLKHVLLVAIEGRSGDLSREALEAEARRLGIALEVFMLGGNVGEARDFELVSSWFSKTRADAVICQAFPREHPRAAEALASLASRGVPAIFPDHRIVRMGGLVSLGARIDPPDPAPFRTLARVLRGESPATIPVIQTNPHLAINLKAAREMKLAIPQSLHIRADELIG